MAGIWTDHTLMLDLKKAAQAVEDKQDLILKEIRLLSSKIDNLMEK